MAIENARLYESATRWSRQLESLNEIGNALVGEIELAPLLELVARGCASSSTRGSSSIALPHGDELRIEAADGEGAESCSADDLARALEDRRACSSARRSERVDSMLDDLEVDQRGRAAARRARRRSTCRCSCAARPIGVIAAHDKLGRDPRFSDDDLRLAEAFAGRAAVAVDLSRARRARRAAARRRRARSSSGARLARELHDETGQALTSILLGLRAVEEAKDDGARRRVGATCASSSSRRCRTCAGSRSSCGRARSTTSGSCRRSSG